jgi:hypothetical protein
MANEEISRCLDHGEKLLWAGRPVQGIVFAAIDWYLIPFSIVWLGLTLGIFGSASQGQANPMGGLMGLFFVGIGIYMLVGRYIVDWLYRSGVFYGVTDRRAVILSGIFSRSVHSIDFASLTGLKLEERGDGSGTIFFGDQSPYAHYQQWNVTWGGVSNTQFFRVPEVKKAYEIVRDAMRRAKSRP